jgi:5-formyltetrahydrofolate cyclo-ligase
MLNLFQSIDPETNSDDNRGVATVLIKYQEHPMITSQKKLLRIAMKEKRALLFQQNPDAGDRIATFFFEIFDLPPLGIVGAYWPIGSELDVRPLIKKLMEKGFRCALPRITPQGLEFHLWTEPFSLVKGSFQVFEPLPIANPVVPDALLVPLLSFDKRRHRLGYGQGHFDRYLHEHSVLTIGIGFKGQQIEELPTQPHDFALDYILTEEGLIS